MTTHSRDGIVSLCNYAGAANDGAAIDLLIALIPNVDTTSSSGAQGGGGFFDEMNPTLASQLQVELAALRAAIVTTNTL